MYPYTPIGTAHTDRLGLIFDLILIPLSIKYVHEFLGPGPRNKSIYKLKRNHPLHLIHVPTP